MLNARRSYISHYDGLSIQSILQEMHDLCSAIESDFQRVTLQRDLTKLRIESEKPYSLQDHDGIRECWTGIKPTLRAFGIWRGFDSPHVKAKIVSFVKGH